MSEGRGEGVVVVPGRALTVLVLAFIAQGFGQELPFSDDPLAKIGSRTAVTQREFGVRFELSPSRGQMRAVRGDEGKEAFLLSLVAEKLLADAAREAGVTANPAYRQAVADVERLLVRDELYRRQVRDRVTIPDDEIAEGVRRSRTRMRVVSFFAADEDAMRFVQRALTSGTRLQDLTAPGDSAGGFVGPDTIDVRWGEGSPVVEDVCYQLAPGVISRPVESEDGYTFFSVLEREAVPVQSGDDPSAERERVAKLLRGRKEADRAFEYMGEALRGKKLEVRREVFRRVVEALTSAAERNTVPAGRDSLTLTDALLDTLRESLGREWDDPLIELPDREWTVGEALRRVRESGFAVAAPVRRHSRTALDARLRGILYQELLADEGYRQGLQNRDAVRWKLGLWGDSYLASFMEERIRSDSTRGDAKDLRDRVVAALADRQGVAVNHALLAATRVTQMPALFYQLLGFGGRILAVPLLRPDTDWLQYCRQPPAELP